MTAIKMFAALAVLSIFALPARAQETATSVEKLPLSTAHYEATFKQKVLTIPQQRARFASEQRMLRMEFNNWIGYSPLRPDLNASYMSQGSPSYYIPSRGIIVSSGNAHAWYW